jgi:hypothetical protein
MKGIIKMNSLGHLIISLVKSLIRLLSCGISVINKSVMPIAIGFALAELLGIMEEAVDKR